MHGLAASVACVTRHVVLTADPQLLSRLRVLRDSDETSLLTLLPEEAFIPGISFEQLCRLLINQIKTILSQAYPSGPLTVIIQTSATDKKRKFSIFPSLGR
jgi:hypothetical protein